MHNPVDSISPHTILARCTPGKDNAVRNCSSSPDQKGRTWSYKDAVDWWSIVYSASSLRHRESDLGSGISSLKKSAKSYHRIPHLCRSRKTLCRKDGIFYFQQYFLQQVACFAIKNEELIMNNDGFFYNQASIIHYTLYITHFVASKPISYNILRRRSSLIDLADTW